jgi:DNA-directed RNA polymerase subunit RPC12/RpoP
MDRSGYTPRDDFDELQYRRIVNAGIAAVKAGDLQQARQLLHKATEMKLTDPDPWLWLSATTDDPAEQRDYLEYALASDPGNAAARRGLVLLSDKLDKSRLLAEGEGVQPRSPAEPEEASVAESYTCSQCGGRMAFEAQRNALVCESCGHIEYPDLRPAADTAEQVLDFVLPTTRGHRWAEAQHRLSCSQCGAVALLAVGERVNACPYCGSDQLIESAETQELLDPNVVGLIKIKEENASYHLKDWLGKGLFAPDDLKKIAKTTELRSAYYPFWTFDGTLAMNWACESNDPNNEMVRWVTRDGVEFEMFDDVLVSGLRSISVEELSEVEPFELKEVVVFDPSYLAGWTVLAYDKPLAEATLEARERVAKKLRREVENRILVGHQKRELHIGELKWSGMTFKHVLLPLWVGHYRYRGKYYRILINGQTGKVGGQKPRDQLKVFGFVATLVLSCVVLLLILALIGLSLGWFSLP